MALCCSYDQILNENREIDGLETFGQPMVARTDLVEYLDDVLLGRYARFANKSDVVTRIPPSYRPCGSLVWFTDNGVKRSKPKRRLFGASKSDVTDETSIEIEPMTEEEFQHLLRGSEESPKVEYGPDGRPMMKGNSPLFADHSMFLYADRVRELLGL